MTTYSFTIEIDELERHLLECMLKELEEAYQADPSNAQAISLGRKSRYQAMLDKIKNSKPNLMSSSSFVENEPINLPFKRPT